MLMRPLCFARTILQPHPNYLQRVCVKPRAYTASAGVESKYAEKLHQYAAEKGISVDELKSKLKEGRERETRRLREKEQTAASQMTPERAPGRAPSLESSRTVATPSSNVRKDSSPVKPLSSILNMTRILSTPHTPAQISALWTAYHTARSNVCASIAVDMYERMVTVARKHASFVVPLARAAPEGGKSRSYEFFFMQWDFHGSPPPPSMACDDPFLRPAASDSDMVAPQTSTILFTPLQEFKLRASYATPYLVITHYTDLARSHGIVLLRGEITPGNGAEARYLVSQADAQLLALAVQRFYLWDSTSSGESQGEKLLKQFHERPKYFKWEELLNHADLV